MNTKKDFKYYLRFYFLVLVVYLVYILISAYTNDWNVSPFQLYSIIYLPLLFVVFVFIFDTIMNLLLPRKKEQIQKDDYSEFVKKYARLLEKEESFTIEDYRRMRESDRFQKALHHLYKIHEEGETQEMNFVFIEKKLKKDTVEGKAINLIIKELKNLM